MFHCSSLQVRTEHFFSTGSQGWSLRRVSQLFSFKIFLLTKSHNGSDGCNIVTISLRIFFVLFRSRFTLVRCKLWLGRLMRGGFTFTIITIVCRHTATTVQPFVVRLFLLISLTRSSRHWGFPRPHRNSCYLALSSPFLLPLQYCVHRGVRNWTFSPPFCLSQTLLSCWAAVSRAVCLLEQ